MPVHYTNCKECGVNPRRTKGRYKGGNRKYGRLCNGCHHRQRTPEQKKAWNYKQEIKRRPWLLHRKNKCERCGFIPEDKCQLDVDHINGDNSNNDPDNYMTLCANCHRLKTKMSGDHLTPSDQRALRNTWRQGELFN